MKRSILKIILLFVCVAMVTGISLTGCTQTTATTAAAAETTAAAAETTAAAAETTAAAAETTKAAETAAVPIYLTGEDPRVFPPITVDGKEILPVNSKNVGPNGEAPVSMDEVIKLLTPDAIQKIKDGQFTAAICLHTTAADWSQLELRGMQKTLEKYGVKLIAQTDANWQVDKQVSDLESLIQLKPNLIIGFTLDRASLEATYKKAKDAGIILSFIDSTPNNFNWPADYASLALADNYEMGWVAAEMLSDAIGGAGEVGILDFNFSMFHTDQRSKGIRDYFATTPDIKVVATQAIGTAEEAATATENWLTAHPNLKGIATVWDGFGMPAAGVIDNKKSDVKVTSIDLSDDSAFSIVSGGALIGLTTQHPYDQGVIQAMSGLLALVGVQPPAYVLVPCEKVTPQSMIRAYYRVERREIPKQIMDAIKSNGLDK